MPWTGADVAFLFLLSVVVWPGVVSWLLARLGFFEWMYGPAAPGELPESVKFKQSLWINVFAFPLDVVTILGFLRLSSQARLYHLGLTCHRGLQNVLLSLVVWATVTPGIYLLAFAVDVGSERILHQAPEEHPLIKLAQERPGPAELAAIVFAAIIAAPIREELLFRGVLQRWCMVRAWGSDVVLAAALTLAWLEGGSKGLWPVLFVLAMIPGYVLVSRSPSRLVSNPDAARAVYASALLFAAFHSSGLADARAAFCARPGARVPRPSHPKPAAVHAAPRTFQLRCDSQHPLHTLDRLRWGKGQRSHDGSVALAGRRRSPRVCREPRCLDEHTPGRSSHTAASVRTR